MGNFIRLSYMINQNWRRISCPSYKLLAFGLHHLHISIFLVLLHYIGLSYAINDDDDDDDDVDCVTAYVLLVLFIVDYVVLPFGIKK